MTSWVDKVVMKVESVPHHFLAFAISNERVPTVFVHCLDYVVWWLLCVEFFVINKLLIFYIQKIYLPRFSITIRNRWSRVRIQDWIICEIYFFTRKNQEIFCCNIFLTVSLRHMIIYCNSSFLLLLETIGVFGLSRCSLAAALALVILLCWEVNFAFLF